MPVRDRLSELQEKSKYCKGGQEADETEMKPLKKGGAAAGEDEFEQFLEMAQNLAADIAKVQQNVDNVRILQKKVLNEPSRKEREKHQAALSDLIDDNKRLGKKLQKIIKEEQAKVDKLEKKKLNSKESSELNIRRTQIQTYSKRFLEIWTEYNNLQVDYRDRTKKALVKNIKITNSRLTDEEIEEKIDNNDVSAFSSAIIQETALAKDQLQAIENRHAEILKLERGIVEIHDMFIDLSNLVSMQGEMIDRIDVNIGRANIDVEKGKENLQKAERLAIKGRKMKLCFGITIAVIVLIVILVILGELGAFSSSDRETVTIIERHYHFANGTSIVSDRELDIAPPSPTREATSVAPAPTLEQSTTAPTSTSSPADEDPVQDYDVDIGSGIYFAD